MITPQTIAELLLAASVVLAFPFLAVFKWSLDARAYRLFARLADRPNADRRRCLAMAAAWASEVPRPLRKMFGIDCKLLGWEE